MRGISMSCRARKAHRRLAAAPAASCRRMRAARQRRASRNVACSPGIFHGGGRRLCRRLSSNSRYGAAVCINAFGRRRRRNEPRNSLADSLFVGVISCASARRRRYTMVTPKWATCRAVMLVAVGGSDHARRRVVICAFRAIGSFLARNK